MTFTLKCCAHYAIKPIVLMAILAGCAGPKIIDINSEASSGLNRDARGKPLSVVVSVYQLKSAQEFNRLTIESLNGNKPVSELLGASLLGSKEITLVPGTKLELEETIQQGAQFVGVVAYFRQPNPHFWRLLYDADRVRSKDLKFKASDCYLQAIKPETLEIPGQPPAPKKIDCPAGR